MSELPQALIDIFKEIGLTKEQATWDCHGTPVALHKALEQVAEHLGIVFDVPTIIDASAEKKYAAVLVSGRLKDRFEWSVGEAASYNNKNSYPFAMAEKRAKDRVILKLIGVAGFVYSEDEADAFKEERPDNIGGVPQPQPAKPAAEPPAPPPADEIPLSDEDMWEQWVNQQLKVIAEAVSIGQLTGWGNKTRGQRGDLKDFDREMTAILKDAYDKKYEKLNSGERHA